MKKLLCALLAGLILVSAVACAKPDEAPVEGGKDTVASNADKDDEKESGGTVEKDTTKPAGDETKVEVELETDALDYTYTVPEDLVIDKKNVCILYSSDQSHGDELVPDSLGGVVSDSVKERNMKVQEELGITLKLVPRDDCQQVASALNLDVAGNVGEFEIVANGTYLAVQPVIEGKYVNLTALDYIDTSKHYWTQGYNDMVTFTDENMQFLASGPAAISMFRLMYLTIYNKQLFEDNKIADLFETVKANRWTLDYQYELVSQRHLEMDATAGASEGDFFGLVTGDTISVDPYLVASDLHLITKDENGNLMFDGGELPKLVELCDKVQKLYNDQSTWVYKTQVHDDVGTTDIINHFNDERALMATTLFLQMEQNFDKLSDLTYGIAPMPKFDEQQESYHSYVQDQVTCFGISAGISDPVRRNELSAVMESLAYNSYQIVRPAYYDTALSDRYMQDPQSNQVLDMIFDTLDFDFSSTCSNIFGSSSVIRDLLRPLLSGNGNTISSATKGWEKRYNNQIGRNITPKLDKLKGIES